MWQKRHLIAAYCVLRVSLVDSAHIHLSLSTESIINLLYLCSLACSTRSTSAIILRQILVNDHSIYCFYIVCVTIRICQFFLWKCIFNGTTATESNTATATACGWSSTSCLLIFVALNKCALLMWNRRDNNRRMDSCEWRVWFIILFLYSLCVKREKENKSKWTGVR